MNSIDIIHSRPLSFICNIQIRTVLSWLNLNRLLVAVTVLSLSWYPPANAAVWQITPSMYAGMEYRDNFNLTGTPLEIWRGVFSGAVESDYRTDRGGVLFNGRYRGSRYISNTDLNQDEGFVNVLADYADQLNLWELDAGIALEQPSSSQLQAGNQIFNIITRNRWHVTPTWTRELSDYNEIKLGYTYQDTSYDDIPTLTTRFSDYFKHLVSATYTQHLTEYSDVLVIGTYTKTNNESLRFNSDQYIIQAAFDHQFSDTLNFYFAAGGVWLVSHPGSNLAPNATRKNTNADFVIRLNLEKKFTYTRLSLGYDRYMEPSVSGGYLMRNQITAQAQQEISEQLTGLIRIRAFQSDQIQGTLSQSGRQQFSGRIELSWEILENLFLNGGYQYAWQDLSNAATGPGKQNTVFLTLRYEMSPHFIFP